MKIVIAFATAAVALAAGVAQGQTGPASTRVGFSDLDLTRADGRAALERRVGHAVDQVCPPRPLPRELTKQQAFRACRKAAWAGASEQLATLYHRPDFAEAAVLVSGQLN